MPTPLEHLWKLTKSCTSATIECRFNGKFFRARVTYGYDYSGDEARRMWFACVSYLGKEPQPVYLCGNRLGHRNIAYARFDTCEEAQEAAEQAIWQTFTAHQRANYSKEHPST